AEAARRPGLAANGYLTRRPVTGERRLARLARRPRAGRRIVGPRHHHRPGSKQSGKVSTDCRPRYEYFDAEGSVPWARRRCGGRAWRWRGASRRLRRWAERRGRTSSGATGVGTSATRRRTTARARAGETEVR